MSERRKALKAILKGDIESLDALIQDGLDINALTDSEMWNLLHQAQLLVGSKPPIEALAFLISKGVSVNGIDVYGNSPLHYAVRNKDVDAIRLLLDAGARVDEQNKDGISPLHQSLIQGPVNLQVVEILLSVGARKSDGSLKSFVVALANPELSQLFEKYQKTA